MYFKFFGSKSGVNLQREYAVTVNIKIDVLGLIDQGFIKEICKNRLNFITMQNISPFETSKTPKQNNNKKKSQKSEIGNAYKIIKY